jgi:hypothetical protein
VRPVPLIRPLNELARNKPSDVMSRRVDDDSHAELKAKEVE